MDRTRRIFTHGWIGASALNLFTGGYYPATVVIPARGRVCAAIHLMLPGAPLAVALPGAEMTGVIPGAPIEMECCCD